MQSLVETIPKENRTSNVHYKAGMKLYLVTTFVAGVRDLIV
jgi:hypothetical protein